MKSGVKMRRIIPHADPNWSPDDVGTAYMHNGVRGNAGFSATTIDPPPGVGPILAFRTEYWGCFVLRSNGEWPVLWHLRSDYTWEEVVPPWGSSTAT